MTSQEWVILHGLPCKVLVYGCLNFLSRLESSIHLLQLESRTHLTSALEGQYLQYLAWISKTGLHGVYLHPACKALPSHEFGRRSCTKRCLKLSCLCKLGSEGESVFVDAPCASCRSKLTLKKAAFKLSSPDAPRSEPRSICIHLREDMQVSTSSTYI